MRYSAVIAAAGLSSRMREFKPMLCLGDGTMIGAVVAGLRAAGVGEIVVVTGYKADILGRHVESLGARVCENRDYAATEMFDSVAMGLRALSEPYDAVFVTPGDVPLVLPETLSAMIDAGAKVVRPLYGEKIGHPVLISAELVPKILSYSGAEGLNDALISTGEDILDLPVDDRGVLMDADTQDDLRALRRRKHENCGAGRLWPDVRVNITRSEAVLTPELAQYVEMIGHTGSIQNACGCMHMSYTKGWRLLNMMERELGFPMVERLSGGPGGGGSVLTANGARLLEAYAEYREAVSREAGRLFEEIFDAELRK